MAINVKIDAELAHAAWLAEEEETRQKNIVMARKYYNGDHDVMLTERQKEYLGHQLDDSRFAVNYCATIVNAVYERMIVKGFKGDNKDFTQWAWDQWKANRLDAVQMSVYLGAVRDGEYFVFVDWDAQQEKVVLIPHQRYTDASFGGEGYGCKVFYPDDDVTQPAEKASKRWVETTGEGKSRDTHRRMTVYYPDRIEKWTASTEDESGWEPIEIEGEPWPIPWTEGKVTPGMYDGDDNWQANPNAKPLGIPIIHFYNPQQRTELWDAVPVQDLVNKTALDILATADAAGFPINVASGFTPTSDGLDPASDGSNYLKVFPGCWIGPIPAEGSVDRLPPADIGRLLDALDSWIIKLAQVTDTPISRFQITRAVAAEGTLKQQEEVLLAKVRNRQTLFGNGWEDCMYMAAKVARKAGAAAVPDVDDVETLWAPAETRDEKAFREAMLLEMQVGVPPEMLWQKLGYDDDAIATMKAMRAEEQEQSSNIGGALLEAFERGQA